MTAIPDFPNEAARKIWFRENAEYFTIIYRKDKKNQRVEAPSLVAARTEAMRILQKQPTLHLLIYAVVGASDNYVETIQWELPK